MSRAWWWLAALAALFALSWRVPVDARDLGFYVNGFICIGAITFLWREER